VHAAATSACTSITSLCPGSGPAFAAFSTPARAFGMPWRFTVSSGDGFFPRTSMYLAMTSGEARQPVTSQASMEAPSSEKNAATALPSGAPDVGAGNAVPDRLT